MRLRVRTRAVIKIVDCCPKNSNVSHAQLLRGCVCRYLCLSIHTTRPVFRRYFFVVRTSLYSIYLQFINKRACTSKVSCVFISNPTRILMEQTWSRCTRILHTYIMLWCDNMLFTLYTAVTLCKYRGGPSARLLHIVPRPVTSVLYI